LSQEIWVSEGHVKVEETTLIKLQAAVSESKIFDNERDKWGREPA
jgi:hypothetical protein